MSQQTPATKLPPLAVPTGTERPLLFGAVAFVEGVAGGWGCWELTGWFEDHLVAAGHTNQSPSVVLEQGFGVIVIDPRASGKGRPASVEQLPPLLVAARKRVVETLRAFLPSRSDDRFLHAAIYSERVERKSADDQRPAWAPRVRESDRLSDVVLALFAADILMHREFHEHALCVCEVCGRVSFDPGATSRFGCRLHNVRGHSGGFPRFEI
jgi:hypothetical protein